MADETKPVPVFDIMIGPTSMSSRVIVNGHDVSKHIHGVTVELDAGGFPRITLRLNSYSSKSTVEGAIADVRVIVDPRPSGIHEPTEAEWVDLGRPAAKGEV